MNLSRRVLLRALLACSALLPLLPVQHTRAQAPLSLGAAQREARERAPEAHAWRARVRAAGALARDAERVFRNDPSVALHYASDIDGAGDTQLGAALSLTLDVAGTWGPRAAAAAAEREQTSHDAEDGLRTLDEAVAIAVAELAFAQRQHERAGRVASLQVIVANGARQMLELGQGNQLEDDAAQLDLASARAELARAEGARELAATRLARLLGRRHARGLRVEDPQERAETDERGAVQPGIERAPAVRAASAALAAARHELALQQRLVWPTPTLELELEREQRAIPAGAFPAEPGLSAHWNEWQLGVRLAIPLGVLDRNRERRTQAGARLLQTEAELELVRAETFAAFSAAQAELRAAAAAYRELEPTAALLERSYDLLEQAARAGSLDAVARAQALQRLAAAGRELDSAVRDLRITRARFIRHTP